MINYRNYFYSKQYTMKQLQSRIGFKTLLTSIIVFFFQLFAQAQNTKVEINGNDVGSWFSRNWIWVAGTIVVLFILLVLSGGSRSRRSKTTVIRKDDGTVIKTTTTESDDED